MENVLTQINLEICYSQNGESALNKIQCLAFDNWDNESVRSRKSRSYITYK